jgi:hypothetical protein
MDLGISNIDAKTFSVSITARPEKTFGANKLSSVIFLILSADLKVKAKDSDTESLADLKVKL